jgi:plasmid stabilization system protein ParE
MRLRLSPLALSDLHAIHAHTVAYWGHGQADHYLNQLWDELNRITEAPERGMLRNDLYSGCRVCTCGKHVILYRVHSERTEIARILHSSMDFPRHVPTDFMGDS